MHLVATVLVVAAGAVLGVSHLEWVALVLAIASVWFAEALNTAFELLCDVTQPDFHPVVKKAKDVSAGAVLLAAIGAVVIGGLVFGPRILERLG